MTLLDLRWRIVQAICRAHPYQSYSCWCKAEVLFCTLHELIQGRLFLLDLVVHYETLERFAKHAGNGLGQSSSLLASLDWISLSGLGTKELYSGHHLPQNFLQ